MHKDDTVQNGEMLCSPGAIPDHLAMMLAMMLANKPRYLLAGTLI